VVEPVETVEEDEEESEVLVDFVSVDAELDVEPDVEPDSEVVDVPRLSVR